MGSPVRNPRPFLPHHSGCEATSLTPKEVPTHPGNTILPRLCNPWAPETQSALSAWVAQELSLGLLATLPPMTSGDPARAVSHHSSIPSTAKRGNPLAAGLLAPKDFWGSTIVGLPPQPGPPRPGLTKGCSLLEASPIWGPLLPHLTQASNLSDQKLTVLLTEWWGGFWSLVCQLPPLPQMKVKGLSEPGQPLFPLCPF